ncbi:hypothetical protein [Actinomadura rubrisoli]|uniref:Uncharacterized protein n=1 Tax=Actinomadura rubrisoli TaxID=2530368 RepID=A0A4R5A2Q6_9ACTN|nr:hypothetical protein [Actinomadura rubrisoli]TDD65106.1 hypothetical protein E1298_41695 [Actinomadura rubrisoli]
MSVDKPRESDESRDLGARLYGPVNAVYVELRAGAPGVVASCKRGHYEPATRSHLRVSYRAEPARVVTWDEEAQYYVWVGGPDDGGQLGREPRRVAARIAETLGAPFSAPSDDPAAEGRTGR